MSHCLWVKITRRKSIDINDAFFTQNHRKYMKRFQVRNRRIISICYQGFQACLVPRKYFKVTFKTVIEKTHNLLEDLAECLCGCLFFSLFLVKALPLAMETRSKSVSSLLTGLAWKQWERMYTIMKQNVTFSECSSHYPK